eukprot:Opistho-2@17841
MSVNVLVPGGRRINVKTTPTMTLLQILETICEKQKLDVKTCGLKRENARVMLDLSLNLRFANIPNNGNLELVTNQIARIESDVVIFLQMDTGTRLQHPFPPSTTLWEILSHWDARLDGQLLYRADESGNWLVPVCVYINQQFQGPVSLSGTPLRQIGLTKGSAVIRVLHAPSGGVAVEQAKVDHPPTLPALTASSVPATAADSSTTSATVSAVAHVTSNASTESTLGVNALQSNAGGKRSRDDDGVTMHAAILREGASAVKVAGSVYEDNSGNGVTPMDIDRADEPKPLLPPQARALVEGNGKGKGKAAESTCTVDTEPEQELRPFANFKFPDAPAAKQMNVPDMPEGVTGPTLPVDRRVVVFSAASETQSVTLNTGDLPDEFYDVTKEDVMKMLRDVDKERESEQLMTRTLRNELRQKSAEKYGRTVIRIRFPCRTVIQALFAPTEPLSAVFEFARTCLTSTTPAFYLYTSPPKEVLSNSTTTKLFEAGLSPAALVYFGLEQPLALEDWKRDEMLSAELLSAASSVDDANREYRTRNGERVGHGGTEEVSTQSVAHPQASSRVFSSISP